MIKIRLKEIIEKRNITLTEIHQATGISKNTLSLIANGTSKGIQFDTLDKLLSVLNVGVSELIEHQDDYSYDLSKFVIDFETQVIETSILMNYKDVNGSYSLPFKARFQHIEKATSFLFFDNDLTPEELSSIMSVIAEESPIRPEIIREFALSSIQKKRKDNTLLTKAQNSFFEQFMLKFCFNFVYAIAEKISKTANSDNAFIWNEHGKAIDEIYVFNWLLPEQIELSEKDENISEIKDFLSTGRTPAMVTTVPGDTVRKHWDSVLANE